MNWFIGISSSLLHKYFEWTTIRFLASFVILTIILLGTVTGKSCFWILIVTESIISFLHHEDYHQISGIKPLSNMPWTNLDMMNRMMTVHQWLKSIPTKKCNEIYDQSVVDLDECTKYITEWHTFSKWNCIVLTLLMVFIEWHFCNQHWNIRTLNISRTICFIRCTVHGHILSIMAGHVTGFIGFSCRFSHQVASHHMI